MRHEEFMRNKAHEEDHPVLILPNEDGCLLVIGSQRAQKDMTPKQMVQLATLLLDRVKLRMEK